MTGCAHHMPFGTECLDDGRVRFRLWAPQAERVTLRIEDIPSPLELDMAAETGGWFGIVTSYGAPGSRYRYRIDGGPPLPDPASRFQPDDVHGASEVIDPNAYQWTYADWIGRPWREAVLYELHVGTFTPEGSFAAAKQRLGHLADLGVTAIELMPVADFAGARNWGYDGVLPFAPDSSYGRPEELKAFVDRAHQYGLMVLLDVVYNHFGPEGNYLPRIAPAFFTERHQTPWGAAINYDDAHSRTVRDFVIDNAHYWLREYDLDGLRLDAVDTITDESMPDIVEELAVSVRNTMPADRHVHLVLENDANQARYLQRDTCGRPSRFDAQWNDDFHHAAHVLATGESDGYYVDYTEHPVARLGRCLAEGFGYQGEVSAWRGGEVRGESSDHLPPTAFVSFLQNHDQVGNRAFGERLTELASPEAVRALTAILLLAPQPPLLFMGEEWGTTRPFLFFCDFEQGLAERVARGRQQEFAGFRAFADPAARRRIPDPGDPDTFRRSVLDWPERERAPNAAWLQWYRTLLELRNREVVPRLAGMSGHSGRFRTGASAELEVDWTLGDGNRLRLRANLGPAETEFPEPLRGRPLHACGPVSAHGSILGPWAVQWRLEKVSSARSGDG